MSEMWNSRRGVCFAAGVIVLATVAAYCNSFTVPFLFDDIPLTVENPTIRRLWPIGPILLPPGHYAAVQRRPMINASLAINYAISGEKSWSYHAFNLAAHALAALVLFGIVRRTLLLPGGRERFGRAATPLAAAVALLWAVHPLLTDAVTYIIQRTEVFCGLFYLLTLYCTIRGNSARHPATLVRRRRGGLPVGSRQQGNGAIGAAGRAVVRQGILEPVVARGVSASRPALLRIGRQLVDRVGHASLRRGGVEGVWRAWRDHRISAGPTGGHRPLSWALLLAASAGARLRHLHAGDRLADYPLCRADRRVVRGGHRRLPLPAVAGLPGPLLLRDPGAQLELHSFAPAGRRREADVPAAGSGGDGSRGGRISGRAVAGPPGPRVAAGAAHRRHVFDCGRRARPRASHRPSQCRLSQRTFDLAGYNGQDAQERPGPRQSRFGPGRARTFRRSRGRVPESDRTAAQLLGGVQRHRQRARAAVSLARPRPITRRR